MYCFGGLGCYPATDTGRWQVCVLVFERALQLGLIIYWLTIYQTITTQHNIRHFFSSYLFCIHNNIKYVERCTIGVQTAGMSWSDDRAVDAVHWQILKNHLKPNVWPTSREMLKYKQELDTSRWVINVHRISTTETDVVWIHFGILFRI